MDDAFSEDVLLTLSHWLDINSNPKNERDERRRDMVTFVERCRQGIAPTPDTIIETLRRLTSAAKSHGDVDENLCRLHRVVWNIGSVFEVDYPAGNAVRYGMVIQEVMQRGKPQAIVIASVTVLRETVMDFMCDMMRRVYHDADRFDDTVVEVRHSDV